jgi:hypothetical protein
MAVPVLEPPVVKQPVLPEVGQQAVEQVETLEVELVML